jgi:magnesium transporter
MAEKEVQNHLIDTYFKKFPLDAAGILSTFSEEETIGYLKNQPVEIAGEILAKMNPDIAADILEALESNQFKELAEGLNVFLAARLISRFKTDNISQRLELLSKSKSKQIRELISYPPDCAAFIMDTRVTTFKPNTKVKEALKRIRSLKDRKIFQVFLVDDEGHLSAVVPLQNIAVSDTKELLMNLVDKPLVSINALSPREEVVQLIEERKLINLPVVDINNHLLGVIRNDALIDATKADVTQDVQALFGAGREERALSKVSFAVRKRLPWLQINLATAFLAASVVAIFEDTIAKITVLAVFLPVVAGQSGNTGSQALAVTMRGLALREIGISQWFTVARKEILVGVVNGVAVAFTTSIIVFFWASSFGLAVVIGISMVLSMAIAGFSGAIIPMVLQSLGQDPASSSSIILTTVTDIVGFLSFLGLATALASVLGIV